MGKNTYEQSPVLRRVLKHLENGKLLDKWSAAEFGVCSERTAQRVLRHLRTTGQIHIIEWSRMYNNPTPVYKFGPGESLPRPPAMTNAEKKRNQRKSPAYREKEAAKKRWTKSLNKVVKLGVWGL